MCRPVYNRYDDVEPSKVDGELEGTVDQEELPVLGEKKTSKRHGHSETMNAQTTITIPKDLGLRQKVRPAHPCLSLLCGCLGSKN